MKKIVLGILVGVMVLAISGIVAGMSIPAAQPAKDNAQADNSPIIEEDWELTVPPYSPYSVLSDSPILKALFGVRHEFPGVFTTELTPVQVGLLKALAVELEPVQLYQITKKPGTECGNGLCEPSENENNCPQDCAEGGGLPDERACYPSDQTPWGIVKVSGGSGGVGVDVAVLDTGVYKDHLDLVTRVEQCVDFTGGGPPGTVRIRVGKCEDKVGHGTHVAGTILADAGSDGAGIYGVAPGADLFAYKVCEPSGCWTDDIAAAIDYAATQGVEIVSMSLGGDTQSSLIKDAIDRNPGVLYVAAAGNDGPADGSIDYPAAYVKVIAAGAIDSVEAVPDWSSRGINDGDYVIEEREVEFGTPGVSVESTYNDGCYAYGSGTSMATPHVSGLAAKLWQGTAADTRSYLQSRARANDIWTAGDDSATGFGLPIAP